MRKCPYCAETVPDAADFCPHCYQDLRGMPATPPTDNRSSAAVSPAFTSTVEPSTGKSLLMMVLILAVYYGMAFLITVSLSGSLDIAEPIMGLYLLIAKLVITTLAVNGLNQDQKGCMRYVGVFLLSLLPIVSWLVMYWAGKGLARKQGDFR